MQSSNTKHLIFGMVELIQYLSQGMTLEPGDVIATGTPAGVGDSRQPPGYLEDGDRVEITVDHVGTLRTRWSSSADPGGALDADRTEYCIHSSFAPIGATSFRRCERSSANGQRVTSP